LRYDLGVVKRETNFRESNFDVTCPCCGAVMKIDAATRSIIAHTAPVKPKTFNDMEEAARATREDRSGISIWTEKIVLSSQFSVGGLEGFCRQPRTSN
jgi:hypothetical protein